MDTRSALAAAGLLLLTIPSATAGPTPLGRTKEGRSVVVGNAERVGSGVLVIVQSSTSVARIFELVQVAFGCRGDWVTDAIRFRMDGSSTSDEQRFDRAAESFVDPVSYSTEIGAWRDSELEFASLLRPKVPQLCRDARPAHKRTAIPFASAKGDASKGVSREVYSLLTSSTIKGGKHVEAWIRVDEFAEEPVKGVDGEPLTKPDGSVLQTQRPTGEHQMSRVAIDCSRGLLGSYQHYRYNKLGHVTDSDSQDRDKLKLQAPVPMTVGEAELEFVCRLFGG